MHQCSLYVCGVFVTWLEGKVHVLIKESTEEGILPRKLLTLEHYLPQERISHLVEEVALDSLRVIVRPLPLSTETIQNAGDTFIRATAPYLALVPNDVFIGKGCKLVPLEDLMNYTGLSLETHEILVEAKALLRKLIGCTTACLHMIPVFFNNVEINRIHNYVLGGEVNRMTLKRRYRSSGYVVPTGEKVGGSLGRQPDLSETVVEGLVDFETMMTSN